MKKSLKKPAQPKNCEVLKLPFNIGADRKLYLPKYPEAGIQLKLYGHKKSKKIQGYVMLGKLLEGPPHFAHGGALAYVLDEAMGSAAWNARFPAVAEKIEVFYHKMVPQLQWLSVKAYVEKVGSKRIRVCAAILSSQGEELTSSIGSFHILKPAQLKSFSKATKVDLSPWIKKNRK